MNPSIPYIGLRRFSFPQGGLLPAVLAHVSPHVRLLPHMRNTIRHLSPAKPIYALLDATPLEIEIFRHACSNSGCPVPQLIIETTTSPVRSSSLPPEETSFILNLSTRTPAASSLSLKSLLQCSSDPFPMHIVPVLFLWHRHPRRSTSSSLLTLLQYGKQITIGCGNVISISEMNDRFVSKPDTGTRAFRWLRREILREKRIITGPVRPPPGNIIENILADRNLDQTIHSMAQIKGKSIESLKRKAACYIQEIAACYNDLAPRIWKKVLHHVFPNMFHPIEFEEDSLNRFRNLLRKTGHVVLVPTHRSHIDYIALSYTFYDEGIVPPLVAAGKNLSFWPMGFIFRHTGAFFIRRSFRGLDLYPHVFKAYIRKILRDGYKMEFFPEGGRSRSGRLLSPKLGILNILLETVQKRILSDITLVPIAVNYDRILEEKSYIKELHGQKKEREHARHMLKNIHLLKEDYGGIYITMGDPVSVRDFPVHNGSDTGCKEELGWEIMNRLRRAMTVTPVGLLTLALFSLRDTVINGEELLIRTRVFHRCLQRQGAVFSKAFSHHRNLEMTLLTAMYFLLQQNRLVHASERTGGMFSETARYVINLRHRLFLDYQRNGLIGILIPAVIAAFSERWEQPDAMAKWVSHLLCPFYLPVQPDALKAEITAMKTFLAPRTTWFKGVLTAQLLPLFLVISDIWKTMSEEHLQFPDINSFKRYLAIQLKRSETARDFPELQTKEMQDIIRKIFLKRHGLDRNEKDILCITGMQENEWHSFQAITASWKNALETERVW